MAWVGGVKLASALLDELVLFSAVGFLITGLDDLAIDGLWAWNRVRKTLFIYRRHPRATLADLPPPLTPGRIAVFIPAWDESRVLGPMLSRALSLWAGQDYCLFVGSYPNDPATIAVIEATRTDAEARAKLRHVRGARMGPITKAECLNRLWQALLVEEEASGIRFKAILLHDAEDVVHRDELALFSRMIERAAFVQIPVHPLVDPNSRWIGGHYCDEFAEAHGKTMIVREAIGAGLPAAGVGCAIARTTLEAVATSRGGIPFSEASLTEDYELGLRIAELGARGIFVALPAGPGRDLVAVRAHFPGEMGAAVRQKSRWITGIALAGWDRLGWGHGLTERWMRLHDRRSIMGALILLCAYAALVGNAALAVAIWLWPVPRPPMPPGQWALLLVCSGLLCWRLMLRCAFTTRRYGWREGVRSVPRAVLGNIIAMIAAREAVRLYLSIRREGRVRWEKTAHQFPKSVTD